MCDGVKLGWPSGRSLVGQVRELGEPAGVGGLVPPGSSSNINAQDMENLLFPKICHFREQNSEKGVSPQNHKTKGKTIRK